MTHEEALNKILADACPSHFNDNGVRFYPIDLCCVQMVVAAKPLGDCTYKIVSVEYNRQHQERD